MRPNVFLESIRKEGREEGRQEGLESGLQTGLLQKGRDDVLRVLRRRFRRVPKRLEAQVAAIDSASQLDELLDLAVSCASLKGFTDAFPK